MGDLLTFRPRPKPAAPSVPESLTEAEIRARVEAIAEAALDAADDIIALLDRMDGDADLKDDGDAEPSLAAPENHYGSQIGWCRGSDGDRAAEALEIVLPEVTVAPDHGAIVLPWRGSGYVVAAAGVALLEMVAGR
jgi:hypothetical protein